MSKGARSGHPAGGTTPLAEREWAGAPDMSAAGGGDLQRPSNRERGILLRLRLRCGMAWPCLRDRFKCLAEFTGKGPQLNAGAIRALAR